MRFDSAKVLEAMSDWLEFVKRQNAMIDRLRAENQRLREALRDCMSYVDVDNLTMQTKEREWKMALKERGDE